MIPKKIHYCWFGRGEKPEKAQKCIASWRKFMPDYEIIEWNEDNFDVNCNAYTKTCYDQKKYAFLTDYLRLLIVEEQGGIYFDTDVEALKSFDDLLSNGAFIGFENNNFLNTGCGFGAEAHHPVVKQMIEEYSELLGGERGTIGCPILNTKAADRYGLIHNGEMQQFGDLTIYPAEWFNPRDSVTGQLIKTKNTHSIHWYTASWMPWHKRVRAAMTKPLHRIQKWIKQG